MGLLGRTVHLNLPLHPEQGPCQQKAQTVEVFTIQLFNNYTNRLSKTVYQHTLKSHGLSSFYPSKWQSIFVGQIWRNAKRFKKITDFIQILSVFSQIPRGSDSSLSLYQFSRFFKFSPSCSSPRLSSSLRRVSTSCRDAAKNAVRSEPKIGKIL